MNRGIICCGYRRQGKEARGRCERMDAKRSIMTSWEAEELLYSSSSILKYSRKTNTTRPWLWQKWERVIFMQWLKSQYSYKYLTLYTNFIITFSTNPPLIRENLAMTHTHNYHEDCFRIKIYDGGLLVVKESVYPLFSSSDSSPLYDTDVDKNYRQLDLQKAP